MNIAVARIGRKKKILSLSQNVAHTRYNKTGNTEDSNNNGRRALLGSSVPKITHSLTQPSGAQSQWELRNLRRQSELQDSWNKELGQFCLKKRQQIRPG